MNTLKARQLFRNAWRLAAFLAVIFAAAGVHAQAPQQPPPSQPQQQAARYLIIFETSPVMKKNLPVVKGMLGEMFSGNLQNELKTGDDLAVWTVDDKLHTGTFPLENWSPDEAAEYAERLNTFLGDQKFRRTATLSATQPLLDHVVKNSERLTVLIFCDSQSRLTGTPYDDGVNDIITNAAAKLQGGPKPFIVVLRAYHGEYLGCSVNRSGLLNFPKFPAPAKPELPPVVKQTPAPSPAPPSTPATGPVVTPIQALIIVGTNTSTNASAALKPPATTAATPPPQPTVAPATVVPPAPTPAPQPVANPPATIPTATVTPAPTRPASIILTGPPPSPTPAVAPPVQPPPASASVPPPQNIAPAPTTPTPEPSVATTPAVPQATPATNSMATATESSSTDAGYVWPLAIAGVSIVLAIIIVLWLVMRGRRPHGSLITSSMADDPRLPPRK